VTAADVENTPDNRKRVLSGMRPTGRLHIGHYFGALQNWIKLHNDPQYECFFFIADWHALTSDYADTSQVAQNTIEIATDWLRVLSEGLGHPAVALSAAQLPLAAEGASAPWIELAPLLGAACREVA